MISRSFNQIFQLRTIIVGVCLILLTAATVSMDTPLSRVFAKQVSIDPVTHQVVAEDEQANTSIAVGVEFEEIATGLENPVDIQHAGDARLFVIEKSGRIRVINASGTLLDTPFLEIENRVEEGSSEEGLLGLAFDPDYAENGYFYLNYTVNRPDRTRISRFSVSANNQNTADPNSEVVLLEFGQPFGNHNGGQLQFGSDGYLYIATGDGGSGGDPENAGQDSSRLLGKILRIDVHGNGSTPECDPNGAYTIPADNPYVGDADNGCGEIWATGLRNPWRFSFDSATNDMWIGDVGQNNREEINFQPANSSGGENYGWRCYEGNASFDTSGCQPVTAYVAPIHDYGRDGGHCSVTGGVVYRGSAYPNFAGHYIFADYCSNVYWTLSGNQAAPTLTTLDSTAGAPANPTSFGVDQQGEIYVASAASGSIWRIQNPAIPATPIVPPGSIRSYLPFMIQE